MTATQPDFTPCDDQALQRDLQRAALRFEAGVLEELLADDPENIELLAALGQTFARLGEHARSLEVDRRLVGREPDKPAFRYNLACSLALSGDLDGACGELLRSIDLGYRDFDHLMQDEDLVALRADARFGLIQERIEQLVGPMA